MDVVQAYISFGPKARAHEEVEEERQFTVERMAQYSERTDMLIWEQRLKLGEVLMTERENDIICSKTINFLPVTPPLDNNWRCRHRLLLRLFRRIRRAAAAELGVDRR